MKRSMSVLMVQLEESIGKLDQSEWVGWEVSEIPVWDEEHNNWDNDRLEGIDVTIRLSHNSPEEIRNKKENSIPNDEINSKVMERTGIAKTWLYPRITKAKKEMVHQGVEIEPHPFTYVWMISERGTSWVANNDKIEAFVTMDNIKEEWIWGTYTPEGDKWTRWISEDGYDTRLDAMIAADNHLKENEK